MNETKEFIKSHWIMLIAGAAVICAGVYFFAGSRVHDNGVGADTVRHEIGAAREQQHQISEGLQSAESRVGEIAGSLERSETANREAASRADSIEATIEQQRAAIADCQRTLKTIRRRGTKKTSGN